MHRQERSLLHPQLSLPEEIRGERNRDYYYIDLGRLFHAI
jgi:hypothetical protein